MSSATVKKYFNDLYTYLLNQGVEKIFTLKLLPVSVRTEFFAACDVPLNDVYKSYLSEYESFEPEYIHLFVRNILIGKLEMLNIETGDNFWPELTISDMDDLVEAGLIYTPATKSTYPKANKTVNSLSKKCIGVIELGNPRNFTRSSEIRFRLTEYCDKLMEADFMEINNNEYKTAESGNFIPVSKRPLSTFSSSVDTASYGLIRKQLQDGYLPDPKSVRTEELVNYFSYDYPKPTDGESVSVFTETGACPWNKKHRMVRIGVKSAALNENMIPDSHFVFLIDVSGSMHGRTRLDLVKFLVSRLVDVLRKTDRISMVVFSDQAYVKLQNETLNNRQEILNIVNSLYADGGTSGHHALQEAYRLAENFRIPSGNNRVILCTDGDFNIGLTSESDLEEFVVEKVKSDIFLSVFGFGMGNFKDSKVKTLALKGHGNYAYVDSFLEVNQIIETAFSGSMYAMVKDVKIQVEFNPARVNAYRLIGYEVNYLQNEEFNDDGVIAGVMGSNQEVTALYEIMPVGVYLVDPLKYQSKPDSVQVEESDEWLTVKLRYKGIKDTESRLIIHPVNESDAMSLRSDYNFALAVALFGQLLSKNKYIGNADAPLILNLLKDSLGDDPDGVKHELVGLVKLLLHFRF